jgi:hypothetical protein
MRRSLFSSHWIRSPPAACQLSAPSAIQMMRTPRKVSDKSTVTQYQTITRKKPTIDSRRTHW